MNKNIDGESNEFPKMLDKAIANRADTGKKL